MARFISGAPGGGFDEVGTICDYLLGESWFVWGGDRCAIGRVTKMEIPLALDERAKLSCLFRYMKSVAQSPTALRPTLASNESSDKQTLKLRLRPAEGASAPSSSCSSPSRWAQPCECLPSTSIRPDQRPCRTGRPKTCLRPGLGRWLRG